MRILPAIAKITSWTFIHAHTKYICLIFLLFTAFTYPNQTLAADATSTQPKQIGGNETITGAFGIKFGEDIKPYLEGHYATYAESEEIEGHSYRYMLLNPPVNIRAQFTDKHAVELSGIPDDKNRIIVLKLSTRHRQGLSDKCGQSITVKAIMELLRGKYKTIKPQYEEDGNEAYGDAEGNTIKTYCSGNSFNITYKSHLILEYTAYIKAERQKAKDKYKESLKKVL